MKPLIIQVGLIVVVLKNAYRLLKILLEMISDLRKARCMCKGQKTPIAGVVPSLLRSNVL